MAEADPHRMFNIHEAKTQFSKLVDRAHAGEEIIVAKGGKPHARLMPLAAEQLPPRRPGRFRDELKNLSHDAVMAPCFTDEELEQIENSSILPAEH